jgi:group I intron endonuclease
MSSGVYSITNTINKKRYVGHSINIELRWYGHKWRLSKRRHHSAHLQSSWYKYGEFSFLLEILEECDPILEVLLVREQYWIDYWKSWDSKCGYNTSKKANSPLGVIRSPETRRKISETRIKNGTAAGSNHPMYGKCGISNPNYGSHRSMETRQAMSEAAFGRCPSDETKKKMSRSHTGLTLSAETRAKMSASRLGRKVSVETRTKISIANTGKHHTEAARQKMSLKQAGENGPRAKLTWNKVREIREKWALNILAPKTHSQQSLANDYGVSKRQIANIIHNKNWKEENDNGG